MRLNYIWFCVVVVWVGIVLISEVACRIPKEDSFDESFEESTSSERKTFAPAEDAIISFLNQLINTGYAASKIAVNRIGKENQKRREFIDQVDQVLVHLPTFGNSETPLEITPEKIQKHKSYQK